MMHWFGVIQREKQGHVFAFLTDRSSCVTRESKWLPPVGIMRNTNEGRSLFLTADADTATVSCGDSTMKTIGYLAILCRATAT